MEEGRGFFVEQWNDIEIPEGYYAEVLVASHINTSGRESSPEHKAKTVQQTVEESMAEQGAFILAGPVEHNEGRVVYLIAFPIPEDFQLTFIEHSEGGYWEASFVYAISVPKEGTSRIPYERRATYEGAGMTKAKAARELAGLLRALEREMGGGPQMVPVVPDPSSGEVAVEPGNMFSDEPNSRN